MTIKVALQNYANELKNGYGFEEEYSYLVYK